MAKDLQFYANEDMSIETRNHRAELKRINKLAKELGLSSKIAGNKNYIDDQCYASNEMDLLPTRLLKSGAQEKWVPGGLTFRGEKSVFSNFFTKSFVVDGCKYISVEQFLQYSKAIYFDEPALARKILMTTNLTSRKWDDQSWEGDNLTGRALVKVRDRLRIENTEESSQCGDISFATSTDCPSYTCEEEPKYKIQDSRARSVPHSSAFCHAMIRNVKPSRKTRMRPTTHNPNVTGRSQARRSNHGDFLFEEKHMYTYFIRVNSSHELISPICILKLHCSLCYVTVCKSCIYLFSLLRNMSLFAAACPPVFNPGS